MSDAVHCVSEAVRRLRCRDPIFRRIMFHDHQYTDRILAKVIDSLLAEPNLVTHLQLGCNRLTDETGVKLAQLVATSTTIQILELSVNRFSETTYLAMAAALRINTSLQHLSLHANYWPVEQSRIDSAFTNTLIVNSNRPIGSVWRLYKYNMNDFQRLKEKAEELGHPNLQALLVTHLVRMEMF